MSNKRKNFTLIFEASASPSVKTRMIYQQAKAASSRSRLLVVNSEYYRDFLGMEDVCLLGNSETDVIMPIIDNPEYWRAISDAFNSLEQFKAFSQSMGKFYVIPWLVGMHALAGDDTAKLCSYIKRWSETTTQRNLLQEFQRDLSNLDRGALSEDQNRALESCLSPKANPEVLNALVDLFTPMAERSFVKQLDLSSLQDKQLLLVTTIKCLNRNTYASVAYSLMRNMNIIQYLDEGATRTLDSNDFFGDNPRVAAVAVRDSNSLQALSPILKRATAIFANVSTLSSERNALNTWIALNRPSLPQELPENAFDILQEQIKSDYSDALVNYLTFPPHRENQEQDSENEGKNIASSCVVICTDNGELSTSSLEDVLQNFTIDEEDSQNNAVVQMTNQLAELKEDIDDLRGNIESKEAEEAESSDPFAEYPDDFGRHYEDLWSRRS